MNANDATTAAKPEPLLHKFLLALAFAGYLAVVTIGVSVHEPWWDEAQAWLLARDAPISELLSHDLAYEGHPPLWYLILAIPAKLRLPYQSLHIVSALCGIVGVVLLLRLRQVPIAARVLLPFTFYFAYQYTVVAREYVLIPPLLFLILALYGSRDRKVIPFALLLVALSDVSLYGLSLAGGFVLLILIDLGRGRLRKTNITPWKAAIAATLLVLNTIGVVVMLWLPADLSSRGGINHSFNPTLFVQIAWRVLAENLLGGSDHAISGLAANVMAAVLVLWFFRRGVVLEFAVLFTVLLPIAALYFSPWHEGVFFLAMVFTALLALSQRRARQKGDEVAYVIMAVTVAMHCSWTFRSLAYDVRSNFTGSHDAARYIAAHNIDKARLFGAGVWSMEVEPYFDHNVFVNYHNGQPPSFWDWSDANRWPSGPRAAPGAMRIWMEAQLAAKPDFMLVSSGDRADAPYDRVLRAHPEYRLRKRFCGALLWKEKSVMQDFDFDLYERVPATRKQKGP